MGANAVTTVYDFTAGQVLTAAQMDNVNCGIPVFATTTTRDAAFGGAGEKTLAQGQYAYIEATSSLQVYTGTAWITASAKLGQIVQGTLSTQFSTSSTSYVSVGLTATITPTSTTSTVLVLYSGGIGATNGQDVYTTVFRGTTAGTNLGATNGFSKSYVNMTAGTNGTHATGIIIDSPATVSATTYTVAMKVAGAGTSFFCFDNTRASVTLIEVLA